MEAGTDGEAVVRVRVVRAVACGLHDNCAATDSEDTARAGQAGGRATGAENKAVDALFASTGIAAAGVLARAGDDEPGEVRCGEDL